MTTATPAIEISDLTFRYPGASQDTLHGVDLRIEEGDFVAVVGGNGSGKTTLCKSFNGLIPHFWNGDLWGHVRVHGVDTLASSVAELSRDVGYVTQDFGNQIVRPTVREDIAFGLVNFGLEDWEQRTRAAIDALGMSRFADSPTWQLSGGQQHLTALAGCLALSPRILVVDEPVAEVDPAAAHDLYERLAFLNRERGITVVVIEHHAEFVARYARSVVLMAAGGIRWHLPVRQALARTRDLEDAHIPAPQVTQVARAFEPEGPVPLTLSEGAAWLHERGVVPEDVSSDPASQPDPAPDDEAAAVVARMRGVQASYRTVAGPRRTVLEGIDLTIREGERIALVGGNGAGKSTLLSLLAGDTVPREGTVEIDGIDTRTVTAADLADHVALLGQRPESMFLTDSIRADIAMHPEGRGLPDAAALIDQVLDRFDLRSFAGSDGRMLSGGQQRRATLAIGLAMRPNLLLLDEPTSSLDLTSRDDVIALLAALADHIRSVVVATHDMHLVAEWAERVIVVGGGCLLADVTPRQLFSDSQLLERARLIPPQATQLGLAIGMTPAPLSVPELLSRLRQTERPEALASAGATR